ncbi:immunity 49 family protein, partial [Klebsiella pneumoniae]|nr:immunity 49 family protein [Klebsiella pneumoniae]
FWTADSKARTNPVGYIAAAPLAMVTIAHDLDLTIDVESDYLPHHLIRGSWIRGSRSGSQRWKKKLVKDDG